MYILTGSVLEINIETAMRNEILEVCSLVLMLRPVMCVMKFDSISAKHFQPLNKVVYSNIQYKKINNNNRQVFCTEAGFKSSVYGSDWGG